MKEKIVKTIKSKEMKSGIKVLSFILVFVILLEFLSVGVFSNVNALKYKNLYTRAYSFLVEPENSIEIACIGNSDLYSAFVPMRLYEQYGYTSTVISTPHQTTLRSYSFLKELLECQSPKVVIIETDMLYENAPKIKTNRNSQINDNRYKLEYFFSCFGKNEVEEFVENHFRIFTFHDEWKNLSFKNYFKQDDFVTIDHGYNFNNSIKPGRVNDNMAKTDDAEEIPTENLVYMEKIISLLNEKEISILFVQVPSQNSWNYSRHNAVSALAASHKIEFIDLNLKWDEIDFDINVDYRDGGDHLNFYGATKTTLYLGEYIKSNYSNILTDRRDDASYLYWADSNEEFKKKYNVQ